MLRHSCLLYTSRLALDIGSPAEFDLEASAVVEADEAHCEVLNVEGAVFLGIAELGMLAVALRVIVGKLAVGASGNRNGLRIAHEPDGKVDHMYAEVDQGTAAGLCLGGEPAALAGDSAAADPSAASAVYLLSLIHIFASSESSTIF